MIVFLQVSREMEASKKSKLKKLKKLMKIEEQRKVKQDKDQAILQKIDDIKKQ